MNPLDFKMTASRTGLPVALLMEIVSSIRKHAKVERIVLFGSRAGERWNVRSDIDIAVLPERGSSFFSNVVEEEIRTLL
jgi:predicted nucleotidyltransferase